jgi:hypothetical protein
MKRNIFAFAGVLRLDEIWQHYMMALIGIVL